MCELQPLDCLKKKSICIMNLFDGHNKKMGLGSYSKINKKKTFISGETHIL